MGMMVSQGFIHRLSLLSVSPMARTEITGEDTDVKEDLQLFDETAVNFSSQTHAEHIQNVFWYYGLNVEEWAVCQTADNCSVKLKVVELLGNPHASLVSDFGAVLREFEYVDTGC